MEPDNKELADIRRRAQVAKGVQAQRDAEEAARLARARSPAARLARVVTERGWRVGRPQFTIGAPRPRGAGGQAA